jgi:predicted RNase H-like HicB family nuclease
MKRDVHVFVERDEEGWLVGSVPSLPGCHTQARTLDELAERMQEAIEAYLDASSEDAVIADFIGTQEISADQFRELL